MSKKIFRGIFRVAEEQILEAKFLPQVAELWQPQFYASFETFDNGHPQSQETRFNKWRDKPHNKLIIVRHKQSLWNLILALPAEMQLPNRLVSSISDFRKN